MSEYKHICYSCFKIVLATSDPKLKNLFFTYSYLFTVNYIFNNWRSFSHFIWIF
jgi:hypothetical protein